ncbi:hypothetical protein OG21DRAFT_1484591 [Imleria badia]|nr:hypothetical protein OG21DRAFT_1484591 [Imleria badia]
MMQGFLAPAGSSCVIYPPTSSWVVWDVRTVHLSSYSVERTSSQPVDRQTASPLLWQQTWRVERTIPTSDLDRYVTRRFLRMDDGRRRTTSIRTPAMATSSPAPWGAPAVIHRVVNEPGGSGPMASSVVREGPLIIIYPFSPLFSFQLSSLLSDSVPLLRNIKNPKIYSSLSLFSATNYRRSFGFGFNLFLSNEKAKSQKIGKLR